MDYSLISHFPFLSLGIAAHLLRALRQDRIESVIEQRPRSHTRAQHGKLEPGMLDTTPVLDFVLADGRNFLSSPL